MRSPLATTLLIAIALLSVSALAPRAGAVVITIEELTKYHCHDHHPHHCDGNMTMELPLGLGSASATASLDNSSMTSPPWTVTANGSIYVNVSYVGGVGASGSQNFTVAIEDTGGLLFMAPQNATFDLGPGASTMREFAFLYVPDMPLGDRISPRLVLIAPAHGTSAQTWVPLVAGSPPVVTPPEGFLSKLLPIGPLALVALVIAAVLLARRGR